MSDRHQVDVHYKFEYECIHMELSQLKDEIELGEVKFELQVFACGSKNAVSHASAASQLTALVLVT